MNTARTFVRPVTADERRPPETGRQLADAFAVRRSPVPLAGAGRMPPADIGRVVG